MKKKLTVPVRDHRRMVVGPAEAICCFGVFTVGAQYLYIVYTDSGGELPVMIIYIGQCFSGVVNGVLRGGLEGNKEDQRHAPILLPREGRYDTFLRSGKYPEDIFYCS